MKKHTLFLFSLFSTLAVTSQEVMSTQGDSYLNANSSIVFTIDETVVNTKTDRVFELTQGFHQTNWNLIALEDYTPCYGATIFPNLTSKMLNIKTSMFEVVSYSVNNSHGKLILRDKV